MHDPQIIHIACSNQCEHIENREGDQIDGAVQSVQHIHLDPGILDVFQFALDASKLTVFHIVSPGYCNHAQHLNDTAGHRFHIQTKVVVGLADFSNSQLVDCNHNWHHDQEEQQKLWRTVCRNDN